ncbi:MAG: hypothetical protein BMS9Abin03_284 [Thermodesulfobacteriota bacterium]|nr:MAG: hypothetical protein BMS9Abin03_284 [Thermodesulfobacteriota bacterium]
MKEVMCVHCSRNFPQSPRHKNQTHCKRQECRRARKTAWQRQKMRTDPEYMANQKLSNRQWRESHPGYWKEYRKRNPEKTERNRLLQRFRNRRKLNHPSVCREKIAKMDTSKPPNPGKFKAMGQYWLVPVIAKMDALKVNIIATTGSYG